MERQMTETISLNELLGDANAFTPKQRAARATYIEHFPSPPRAWLTVDDPANRLATGIYNTLVESGARTPDLRTGTAGRWRPTSPTCSSTGATPSSGRSSGSRLMN